MKQILYTSEQVRKEIIRIFSTSTTRRVAISAFVGKGAEAYLPNPKGLHIICWPKAGGTNPNMLRKLKELGAKVEFSNLLHMKIFWTKDKGAILTSANLTTNALGSGNLIEIGVLLSPGTVDIDRVIAYAKPRPWSRNKIKELDRQHALFIRNNGDRDEEQTITFGDWYRSPDRRDWKMFNWQEVRYDLSSKSKEFLKTNYNLNAPFWYFRIYSKDYHKEDWIFSFQMKGKSPKNMRWTFLDRIGRISSTDKAYDPEYPYEGIQIHSLMHYSSPPFRIDKRFKSAFIKSISEYSRPYVEYKPSSRFISLIYKNYC